MVRETLSMVCPRDDASLYCGGRPCLPNVSLLDKTGPIKLARSAQEESEASKTESC